MVSVAQDPADGSAGPGIDGRLIGWRDRLVASLLSERERWILWLPVAFGTGIGGYFLLPVEPPLTPLLILGGVALALAGLLRRRAIWLAVLLAVALIALGAADAAWFTRRVAAPVLARALSYTMVTGRIVEITRTEKGRRLLLDRVQIRDLAPAVTPQRVRISLRGLTRDTDLRPGDRIQLGAALSPPAPPSMPGAVDFQRFFWFQRIGAIGFAQGRITHLPDDGAPAGAEIRLARLRAAAATRIMAVLPGDLGAVAAAVMVGEKGAISPDVAQAMRDAGLAHILVIAGLHIGIVATFVFRTARLAMALIPWIALRWPTKKIATLAALAVAGCYAAMAGFTVPTERAFLMGGLALAAVLLDRWALSMRMLAVAAMLILIDRPEQLLGPSFQMSFGAVAVLIAGYEVMGGRMAAWRRGRGPVGHLAVHVAGLALTSLLATAGTALYSAWAFQRIAMYGVLANLIAVPITALLILPAALVAVMAMPFGGEALGLVPMGWGIDLVLWSAEWTARLPGAVWPVPRMPLGGFLAITLGSLWLCLWRGRWRRWGWLAIAAGLVPLALIRPPDVIISGDGALMAIRDPAQGLRFAAGAKGPAIQDWQTSWALARGADFWGKRPMARDAIACDPLGCATVIAGYRLGLLRDPGGQVEDCNRTDILIATIPIRGRCAAGLVIDRFTLWRQGAHALWVAEDGVTVETVRGLRGVRPWAPAPENRQR